MSDRETLTDFKDWMRNVDQQLASLQRGDKLTGRVPVGELMVGDLLLQDARRLPGGKTGLFIKDTKSNALYYIKIPADTNRYTPPNIFKMLFTFSGLLRAEQSMTYPFTDPFSLQGFEYTLFVASGAPIQVTVNRINATNPATTDLITTITIPANVTTARYVPLPFPAAFKSHDQLSLNLVNPGSGAQALDIVLTFGG